MTLECRPIPGFPLYLAREDGEIVSLQKKTPRVLARRPHRGGYVLATLCNDEGQVTSVAHRFIASAFVPNPDNLPCVRHLDGDQQNNRPSNLAWGSYEDNEADKIGHGRRRYGTAKMKLNREDREQIERLAAEGHPPKDLAERFGVHRSTITRLLAGATWKNRKWPMADASAQR